MDRIVYDRMAEHDSTHWWYVARRDILADYIARYVQPPKDARILEIGCGQGPMMQFLRSLGHDVVGIDATIDPLKRWDHRGRVCVASGERLPFPDASFDLVLSFDVFEHVPDSDQHLRDVARVLRRPGHYLIGTPNKWTNSLIEPIVWTKRVGWRRALHCRWRASRSSSLSP